MPARGKPDVRRGTNGAERVAFSFTSNATAADLVNWDLKPTAMQDAVLAGLAAGLGIMFGRSQDGGSISVTIYDGDVKSRKWVSDAIELEDVLAAIVEHAKAQGILPSRGGLRAIGD